MPEKKLVAFEGIEESKLKAILSEKLHDVKNLSYSLDVGRLAPNKVAPAADNCCNGSCD